MKKSVLLAMVLCLVCGCVGDKKTILVIESYHAEYLWDAGYVKGLMSVFGDKYDVQFFHMDTKRVPAEKHQEMANKAFEMYKNLEPDLVVVGDDAALRYTGLRLSRTATPVVFLGINNNPAHYFVEWPRTVTGVLERPLLLESIATLKKFLPGARRVAVLFDTDLTAKACREELFNSQDRITIEGVDVEIKLLGSAAKWRSFVRDEARAFDACFLGLYHNLKDEQGATVDPEEMAVWTSANIAVPLFAFWDFSVHADKAVGGLIVSAEEQGKMAAEIAEKILSGANPRDITPVSGGNGELLFSKTQLAKHNLIVPAGMYVRYVD